jgi:hypothetical protein
MDPGAEAGVEETSEGQVATGWETAGARLVQAREGELLALATAAETGSVRLVGLPARARVEGMAQAMAVAVAQAMAAVAKDSAEAARVAAAWVEVWRAVAGRVVVVEAAV